MDAPAGDRAPRVRRRRVFYLGGFDPQGPAHYHRLYAEEAVRAAAVGGYALSVGPRNRGGSLAATWQVEGVFPSTGGGEERVDAEIEFLRWDDIVRAHWPRARWRVMLSALASTAHQVRNGVLWRIWKTSWPAFLVLAMPPALVLGLCVAALALAGAVGGLAVRGMGLAALAVGGVGSAAWWRFAGWAEQRIQMAWLMRSTRFILRQAGGGTPEFESRLDAFAARVAEAWASGDADEVLVVGHSSGAILSVSVAARALARRGSDVALPALSLLTLGECIPMLSYQPEAEAFRSELAALAGSSRLEWVDVTAPPDGCCFALVDPTAAARVAREVASAWRSPKRLSARFAQMFPPERYEAIRRDKYRCHFQYLMAGERPSAYDYFAITAGPMRLADRFAGHRSVDDFTQFQCFGGPDR